jgi:outer membrane protein assembly factor BamB
MQSRLIGLIGCLCVALTGCTSSDEDAYRPADLPEMENQFEYKAIWTGSLNGVGNEYNDIHPAIGYESLFVADADGQVAAFNIENGKVKWERETDLEFSGGIGIGSESIVLGTMEGDVLLLDATTGETKWQTKVSSEVVSAPAIGDGAVVLNTTDGRIFALNLTDGKELWYFDREVPALSLRGTSSPIIERGAAISTFANGKIAVFILSNGRMAWEKVISTPKGRSELARMVDADTSPITLGDVVYTANYNGNVIAASIRSGDILWQREASVYQDLEVDATLVYVVDAENSIIALERRNGAVFWTNDKLKFRKLSAPVKFDGHLLVADYEGYVHWIDPATGEIRSSQQIDSDGVIAKPITDGKKVVVYGRSGDFEVFSKKQ